jgi:hypothetical protein
MKHRKPNHNFIQAGTRNFAIGSLRAVASGLCISDGRLSSLITSKQAKDLHNAHDLIMDVYLSLARKHFKS